MNQNDIRAVNELKVLAIDTINRAGGGSPGICLSMAPVMYTLFTRVLNIFPNNERFFNRDRVILSCGHITPLYYAMCHMAGFPLKKEDLMNYRRCGSNTPGTPEYHNPVFSEATTGYAGDGAGMAVGIALARRYTEALIKEEDPRINLLDFTTYCFISDADIMSGASEEAFSFAGSEKLNHLVFLYDCNKMSAEGSLDGVLDTDIEKNFASKGFYVDSLKDATNIKEIARTIEAAKKADRPALLVFRTIIGKDSFNEGKSILHSGVLSLDDVNNLKKKYNIFLPPFEISKDSLLHVSNAISERTTKMYTKWKDSYARAKNINSPNLNTVLNMLESNMFDPGFDSSNYKINDGYRESLIETNYKIMNLIAPKTNLFLGGSAGLGLVCQTGLNNTDYMTSKTPKGRNIRFGPRERAMSHILNGMSMLGLHVYGSTFLCYADEMKSGLRLSAIMNLPVTYIFTHDSLYHSEESMVKIPVEELTMLRSIPNFTVYRPADIEEVMGSWEAILKLNKPSALVVSRNSIPKLPGSNPKEVMNGAYIIKPEKAHLDGIIIATGSEVVSALQIAFDLERVGIDLRVVSMPSMELFLSMGNTYIKTILPDGVKTAVIEAGDPSLWYRFATNEEYILGINDFAYNGIPIEVLQKMSYDYDSLKLKIESLMK